MTLRELIRDLARIKQLQDAGIEENPDRRTETTEEFELNYLLGKQLQEVTYEED